MDPHPTRDTFTEFWTQSEDQLATSRRTGWARFNVRAKLLVDLIEDELVHAGLARSHIHRDKRIALPGSYHPVAHRWDLVVLDDDFPLAAVNFKTAIGPSIGKNFSNRIHDILADAVNLGRPYEPEPLRGLRPCLALFFALEDSETSNAIRTIPSNVANDSSFPERSSYKDRYGLVFERLIQDSRYDVICYLASTRSNDPLVSEPHPMMSFATFGRSIVDRIEKIRTLREESPVDPVEFGRMLARRDDISNISSIDASAAEAAPANENGLAVGLEGSMPPRQYQYEVCLSFAGEQRPYVDEVASHLTKRGIKTFYDKYEQANLWGKDLYEHLDSIYRKEARYCIVFASADYARKVWTSHERKSAQARAIAQNGEYILPVKFDNTEIPGLRSTIGYIDARTTSPAQLVSLICDKLTRLKSV